MKQETLSAEELKEVWPALNALVDDNAGLLGSLSKLESTGPVVEKAWELRKEHKKSGAYAIPVEDIQRLLELPDLVRKSDATGNQKIAFNLAFESLHTALRKAMVAHKRNQLHTALVDFGQKHCGHLFRVQSSEVMGCDTIQAPIRDLLLFFVGFSQLMPDKQKELLDRAVGTSNTNRTRLQQIEGTVENFLSFYAPFAEFKVRSRNPDGTAQLEHLFPEKVRDAIGALSRGNCLQGAGKIASMFEELTEMLDATKQIGRG